MIPHYILLENKFYISKFYGLMKRYHFSRKQKDGKE